MNSAYKAEMIEAFKKDLQIKYRAMLAAADECAAYVNDVNNIDNPDSKDIEDISKMIENCTFPNHLAAQGVDLN